MDDILWNHWCSGKCIGSIHLHEVSNPVPPPASIAFAALPPPTSAAA